MSVFSEDAFEFAIHHIPLIIDRTASLFTHRMQDYLPTFANCWKSHHVLQGALTKHGSTCWSRLRVFTLELISLIMDVRMLGSGVLKHPCLLHLVQPI